MRKIAIGIQKDTLSFAYKEENEKIEKKLLNTNVISNDELVFSKEYLEDNHKLVALFVKELAFDKKIKNVISPDNEMAVYVLDIIAKIPTLETFKITDDNNLTFEICEKVVKNKNIKVLNCYSIPTFMIEILDKANILVESRCEVFFTSDFMSKNNLSQYSKLYYKTSVRIDLPISEFDLTDFETFCKISKYLKTINLEKCNVSDLTKIVNILEKNKIKNVKIFIHDNIDSAETADTLRRLNRRWSAKYKIRLKLVYSPEYVKNNFAKQVILMTLKVCSLLLFVIVSTVIGYILINNRISSNNVKSINNKVTSVLKSAVDDEETNIKNSRALSALLSVNSDTVGWLEIKGTNINYPLVQADDNSYYLNRNYNRQDDYNGWVFMDYRNDPENLDKNTILYAHNRYYSGVMFGTLNNVLKKEWYENKEFTSFTFNTLYDDYTWQVFSVYRINVTSDYLKVIFSNDNDFLDFAQMLKNRSLINFETEVTAEDKIVSLSTCLENNRRLVVHAVLVKK